MSIFSKLIGHKLYNGYSCDLYMGCRMNFAAGRVQTQIPQFVNLGFSTINALDESSGLGTSAAIIQRPTGVSHCRPPNHVFGAVTAVGMSEDKSDYDYTYKS